MLNTNLKQNIKFSNDYFDMKQVSNNLCILQKFIIRIRFLSGISMYYNIEQLYLIDRSVNRTRYKETR